MKKYNPSKIFISTKIKLDIVGRSNLSGHHETFKMIATNFKLLFTTVYTASWVEVSF